MYASLASIQPSYHCPSVQLSEMPAFEFVNKGTMAYVGSGNAIAQLPANFYRDLDKDNNEIQGMLVRARACVVAYPALLVSSFSFLHSFNICLSSRLFHFPFLFCFYPVLMHMQAYGLWRGVYFSKLLSMRNRRCVACVAVPNLRLGIVLSRPTDSVLVVVVVCMHVLLSSLVNFGKDNPFLLARIKRTIVLISNCVLVLSIYNAAVWLVLIG
jgi:hypothetical protein